MTRKLNFAVIGCGRIGRIHADNLATRIPTVRLAALAERLQAFIAEWNQVAHPFKWSTKSVAKVMAKCKPAQGAQEGGQPVAA